MTNETDPNKLDVDQATDVLLRNILTTLSTIILDGLSNINKKTGRQFEFCLMMFDKDETTRGLTSYADSRKLLETITHYQNKMSKKAAHYASEESHMVH